MKTDYPQFRKYVGVDTWFRINSEVEFVEIKKLGNKLLRSVIVAEKYPEKLFIQDMLGCNEGRWEVISESDFNALDI